MEHVVGNSRTLLAAVDELNAVLEELAGNIEDLLNLIGHCDDVGVEVRRKRLVGSMQLTKSRVSWRRERRDSGVATGLARKISGKARRAWSSSQHSLVKCHLASNGRGEGLGRDSPGCKLLELSRPFYPFTQ